MPKKVTGATSAAKKPATKAAAKTTSTASTNGHSEKRAAQLKQDQALMATVVKRAYKGDETVGAVAKELSITPGKAAFLIMQHRVAVGEVPAIEAKTEATLVNAIASARAKADEFSSWGWLAARSSKSEVWIKSHLEEAGKYQPKAENIASLRASSKPKAAPAARATGTAKKRTVRGNA